MKSGTARRGTLLVAGIAAAGGLVLTGPASAASGGPEAKSPGSGTDTVMRASSKVAKADAITCHLKIGHPHYSHHAHGNNKHRVNVVATTTCDHKVAALRLKVRLYKSGKPYKTTGWKTNHGKHAIKNNASRRCIKNRKYTGRAWVHVTFPAGYSPPAASGRVTSKTVAIHKCRKK